MGHPVSRSVKTGRFTAAVKDAVCRPVDLSPAGHTVVAYGHGGGNTATEAIGAWGLPAMGTLVHTLAAAGLTVVAPTATLLWGNSTDQTRRTTAITWARTNARGSSAPVVLIGASMGSTSSLLYAADHPAEVAAVIGVIPAVDIQAIRVADTFGLRASIDAAWGVTYPAALPAGADPAARVADFDGIPIQLWYANDDPASVNIGTFAAAVGADLHDVGALGHTAAATAAVDAAAVLAFISAAL